MIRKLLPWIIGMSIGIFLGANDNSRNSISKVPFLGPLLTGTKKNTATSSDSVTQ